MTSLRQVLDRLRSAKLTAKPSKCLLDIAVSNASVIIS